MSTDRRGWMRRLAPVAVFAGCALLLAFLRGASAGPPRLALEAILAAAAGLAVHFALRSAGRPGTGRGRILDSIAEPMLVVLPSGRIITANSAARKRFGRSLDRVGANSIEDLFPGDARRLLRAIEDRLARDGHAVVETRASGGDGSRFAAYVHASRLTGSPEPGLLLHVKEVTALGRADRPRAPLSRRVLTAQEEERTRISRDLHDGLGQIVAALHFEINWLRSRADEGSVATADFEKAVALIDRAGDKLRAICRGLRPPMLDDLGLLPAIRQLADEFAEHWPLEIRLDVRVDEDRLPLPSDVALCTFRVLQEALTNVARHSDASKVDVTLQRDGTMLVMSVYDNGRGFDPARLAGAPGFGIEGMRERARLVDGELELHSAPDRGTRVVFRAPLPLPKEEAVP